jgi:hypothetical protein
MSRVHSGSFFIFRPKVLEILNFEQSYPLEIQFKFKLGNKFTLGSIAHATLIGGHVCDHGGELGAFVKLCAHWMLQEW